MIKPTDFTKIRHDVNGNPRYVCHFLQLDVHGMYSGLDLSERYDIALTLARSLGGKKFHNKQYGGGIVFCTYNLNGLIKDINELMESEAIA